MTVHHIRLEQQHSDAFSAYVARVSEAIRNPPPLLPLSKEKLTDLPDSPGIYAIFENEELVYVGESGCLKERIGDLFRTRNHSFRRSLGEERFRDFVGFERATTKRGFTPEIEAALTKLCSDCLSILIVPVAFGRKEIEEQFVAAGGKLRNKRGRRGG
ncbi:hypothetical protein BSR09_09860 [Stutzerimonas degradans]|jgi:hypothetical protein|nr:hypothetical protein [Pseudomonadaceae bacterium]OOE11554.1 hypothetical protein BSR09_09860 [Stutzerimonas degradans]